MEQYVVDAFTDRIFGGNPAAVCVMDAWPGDGLLLDIARENNLSETAFAVSEGESYRLRWFTPGGEIDLCGHATLATAYTILRFYRPGLEAIRFDTMSGRLTVVKRGDLYEMDFPAYKLVPVEVTDEMTDAIGLRPLRAFMGRDLLCVLEDEEQVRTLAPDMKKLLALPGALLHVTAGGREYDCVSRSFCPKMQVDEDPVCGSGHCHIFLYWARALGKTELTGYQASRRGGVLFGRVRGDRISLAGKAALYAESVIHVE